MARRRETRDLNSKKGNQEKEGKRKKEESSDDQEALLEELPKPFFITGAQSDNSLSVHYLCHSTHVHSNPMTNAADNSITEEFNRGYLGDS